MKSSINSLDLQMIQVSLII